MSPAVAALLADGVLAVHVLVAVFVVAGLPLVFIGRAAQWRWVHNLGFRLAHLAAIAVVAAEAWFGIACPLTLLEMSLRARDGAGTYGGGFVEHWLGRILFYDAPAWVFVLVYSVFGLLVVATWWHIPPRRAGSPLEIVDSHG